MCGIFTLLNTLHDRESIREQFMKGQKRGPEFSKLEFLNDKLGEVVIGFHRLAINGLNETSNQPIKHNDIILICNGEIYNYRELYSNMRVVPNTDSDCEVIIHLYLKYGIKQTLLMLDGVFAFVLYDFRDGYGKNGKICVARDPLGVRPLYRLDYRNTNEHDIPHGKPGSNMYDDLPQKLCGDERLIGFASELKCLEHFYNIDPSTYNLKQFKPGSFSVYEYGIRWIPTTINEKYFTLGIPHTANNGVCTSVSANSYFPMIANYLNRAVVKRCNTTERPVACLLSGGLDSSLIAALAANYFEGTQIETYSIGLEGSEDVRNARIVADYIGSKHTEIILTELDFFNAIPEVIEALESYDTTTVRASLGNYLIGKFIATHSEAKVIFNGDGSDELFGGYLYMNKCPDDIEFDKETRKLLENIYLFDVLRSDKSISSNGLEPRTPFLDRSFVNMVMSIPPTLRNHNNCGHPEKYLLRMSFTNEYFTNNKGLPILPAEILWRKKEAFSDGVSKVERSLFTILQEIITKLYSEEQSPINLEKKYYKEIFDRKFPNCGHILPYFWMPNYVESNDPSARTLDVYK